jgi:hypothetical protein
LSPDRNCREQGVNLLRRPGLRPALPEDDFQQRGPKFQAVQVGAAMLLRRGFVIPARLAIEDANEQPQGLTLVGAPRRARLRARSSDTSQESTANKFRRAGRPWECSQKGKRAKPPASLPRIQEGLMKCHQIGHRWDSEALLGGTWRTRPLLHKHWGRSRVPWIVAYLRSASRTLSSRCSANNVAVSLTA